MKIPNEILAQIARDVDDFYGGEDWNIQLTELTNEEFHQWELLMVAQIVARGVATLDCEIKLPTPPSPPAGKLRKFCRSLLRSARMKFTMRTNEPRA